MLTENFQIYYYKDGYLRTSSLEYSNDNNQVGVHLTNQCLQNQRKDYGTHEEGNTLTFDQFQEYLTEEGSEFNIEQMLVPRMKDIIIDSLMSVRNKMNPNRRKQCFELFGFDFLIDEDYRTWLIEINTNPWLGTPNK